MTRSPSLQNASLQLLVLYTCGKQSHMFSKTDGKCFVSKTEVKKYPFKHAKQLPFPHLALHEALFPMPQNFTGTEKDARLRSEAALSKHIHEMLYQGFLFQGMNINNIP